MGSYCVVGAHRPKAIRCRYLRVDGFRRCKAELFAQASSNDTDIRCPGLRPMLETEILIEKTRSPAAHTHTEVRRPRYAYVVRTRIFLFRHDRKVTAFRRLIVHILTAPRNTHTHGHRPQNCWWIRRLLDDSRSVRAYDSYTAFVDLLWTCRVI
ncbi:hypothetical protein EDD17DRAFT_1559475, partial [Pisolithus thermaeus]